MHIHVYASVTSANIDSDNGLAPSHYQKQWWNIVNWTLRNKLQWNFNRNSYIFIQENAFENVVWKMAAILSRPQCVNDSEGDRIQCLAYSSWYQWLNTLRPRQNGRRFTDVFKCIFLNENVCIMIKISLNFVPKGPINSVPALVQTMAWSRPGEKPLSEPMMVSLPTHICVTQPQWVNAKEK